MAHVELRKVSKSVLRKVNNARVRTQILSNLDLKVERGELVSIMGPSGSGKTTLLRLINRLSEIDSGAILLDNLNLRNIPPMELRRRVGMVFQIPTMFKGRVRDNLAFGMSLWGKNFDLEGLARAVGIGKLLDADAGQLSVGEKQRVCVARALANEPEVLLLDEPTSSLDAGSAEQIEGMLLSLCRKRGLTMIWVTHEREQAERIGGKRFILKEGRLWEENV